KAWREERKNRIRGDDAGAGDRPVSEEKQAKLGLLKARTAKLEMEVAQLRRETLPRADVERALADRARALTASFTATAQIAVDLGLDAKGQAILEDWINGILRTYAAGGMVAARANGVQDSRTVDAK